MLDLAIMIEGQNGLNWPRWQRVAAASEELGFAGLFRSDHFTNANPPDLDSLELWVSLAWLASHTERIEFGPLVTPLSFRNALHTVRMATAVDDLSGGRLILGLGAGWQEREHENYGFDLLDVPARFDRLEEGVQVISALLQSEDPLSFQGEYYRLKEAVLLPRPARPGGPPILIGGGGRQRTLPITARYADEWNTGPTSIEEFVERNRLLDELLRTEGRQPASVRRSMMTGTIFGKQEAEVKEKVAARTRGKSTAEQLRQRGYLAGTSSQITDQLGELQEAGVERVMMQWLDLDDLDGLESIARDVLPHYPAR